MISLLLIKTEHYTVNISQGTKRLQLVITDVLQQTEPSYSSKKLRRVYRL